MTPANRSSTPLAAGVSMVVVVSHTTVDCFAEGSLPSPKQRPHTTPYHTAPPAIHSTMSARRQMGHFERI